MATTIPGKPFDFNSAATASSTSPPSEPGGWTDGGSAGQASNRLGGVPVTLRPPAHPTHKPKRTVQIIPSRVPATFETLKPPESVPVCPAFASKGGCVSGHAAPPRSRPETPRVSDSLSLSLKVSEATAGPRLMPADPRARAGHRQRPSPTQRGARASRRRAGARGRREARLVLWAAGHPQARQERGGELGPVQRVVDLGEAAGSGSNIFPLEECVPEFQG